MQIKVTGLGVSTDTNNNNVGDPISGFTSSFTSTNLVQFRRYKILSVGSAGGNDGVLDILGADDSPSANEFFTLAVVPSASQIASLNTANAILQRVSDRDLNKSNLSNAKCVLATNPSTGRRVIFITDSSGTVLKSCGIPSYGMLKFEKDADQMVWAAQDAIGSGSQSTGVIFTPIAFTD